MRRAGILIGDVIALVLFLSVCLPQHLSSRLSLYESSDHHQLGIDRAPLPSQLSASSRVNPKQPTELPT